MTIRVRSLILLGTAELALGIAGIFVRYALTGTGPFNAALLRVLIAASIIGIAARWSTKRDSLTPHARNRLVLAGCILGLHFATWIMALQYTSVVVATLLVCTTPFWLAIAEAITSRKLPSLVTTTAFITAALAASTVVRFGPAPTSSGPAPLLGAGLALIAALLIAWYIAIMRTARQGNSTLSVIAVVYPSSIIVLAPLAVFAREPFPHTWLSWGGIFGMAIVTQLIGHTALAAALRGFKSSTAAFAGLAEAPIAAVAAALLLGEPLRLTVAIAGMTLLLAIGVVLAADRSTSERTEKVANP